MRILLLCFREYSAMWSDFGRNAPKRAVMIAASPGRYLKAVIWGGLACGVCDTIAAFVVYGAFGAKPLVILQSIASGALGRAAFSGGLGTAALGLFFEFVISLGAAAVFVAASRFWPLLIDQAIPAGVLYGVAVYFFMDRIVVPLSLAPHGPVKVRGLVIGLLIHMACVGLPISLGARRALRSA
jgi:hypothetical protein